MTKTGRARRRGVDYEDTAGAASERRRVWLKSQTTPLGGVELGPVTADISHHAHPHRHHRGTCVPSRSAHPPYWDYVADARRRAPGFVLGHVGRYAKSSYEQLGTHGVAPTLGNSRYVDYVFLDRRSAAHFVSHASLGGFRSDHRPLVAKVRLPR